MPPRAAGPPHAFDEAFYVLDGELTFQLRNRIIIARAPFRAQSATRVALLASSDQAFSRGFGQSAGWGVQRSAHGDPEPPSSLADTLEAEPLVEPDCRVADMDVERHRGVALGCSCE
jgi:hypothetical protein